MSKLHRVCLPGAAVFLLICAFSISAQWNKKPYTEWSEKEATKLLNDSPWCQTQALTSQTTGQAALASGQSRVADVVSVNFRIRFLSAKPVRQAISRVMEIKNGQKISPQLAAQLKGFAAADFPDYIVITVTSESDKASSLLHQTQADFQKLTTSTLKNNTYLLADGQRVFLKEYQPPGNDGLGARYIFPRLVDGKAFITPETGDVLFHSGSNGVLLGALQMRYKVKEMMFDGKLEY